MPKLLLIRVGYKFIFGSFLFCLCEERSNLISIGITNNLSYADCDFIRVCFVFRNDFCVYFFTLTASGTSISYLPLLRNTSRTILELIKEVCAAVSKKTVSILESRLLV